MCTSMYYYDRPNATIPTTIKTNATNGDDANSDKKYRMFCFKESIHIYESTTKKNLQ